MHSCLLLPPSSSWLTRQEPALTCLALSPQLWHRVFLLSLLAGMAVDPLFFYLLSVDPSRLCVYVQAGFAVAVTVLRCALDLLFLANMGLQARLAYVSRASLRLGNGELVTDPRKVAAHYAHPRGGLLLDVLVILPIPQVSRGAGRQGAKGHTIWQL